MGDFILAVDLGTTSCKTALFDRDLRLVTASDAGYATLYPEAGWAEQPAAQWWKALKATVSGVLRDSRVDPDAIAAVGIDAMGSVMLPVDRAGEPLRPGLLWMDRRSEDQCLASESAVSGLLKSVNGNHNDPSNIAPKILWFRENEPELYDRTDCFLHANGYLGMKLTGERAMDLTEGGLTQLFDTRRGLWSDELIAAYGIDPAKLPELRASFDVIGGVTAAAAAETGLAEGTPVVAGSMDMVAAALGSGSTEPGDLYLSGGTVTAAGLCIDRPDFQPDFHLYHHIVPDRWLLAAGVDYGGAGVKWFKDLLDLEDYSSLDAMVECGTIPDHPLLFLPYMVGQRAPLWNSRTRGGLLGLHPSCGRAEVARAMMEGNALGVRRLLELFRKGGFEVNGMKMTGGCANSPPWSRLMADITGLEVKIPGQMDVAVLGAAMTAGVGTGLFGSFEEAKGIIADRAVFRPGDDSAVGAYYDGLYSLFVEYYDATIAILERMKELTGDLPGTRPDSA